jgi:hypothetical protein
MKKIFKKWPDVVATKDRINTPREPRRLRPIASGAAPAGTVLSSGILRIVARVSALICAYWRRRTIRDHEAWPPFHQLFELPARRPPSASRKARARREEMLRGEFRIRSGRPSMAVGSFSRVSRRSPATSMSFGPISSRSGTPRSSTRQLPARCSSRSRASRGCRRYKLLLNFPGEAAPFPASCRARWGRPPLDGRHVGRRMPLSPSCDGGPTRRVVMPHDAPRAEPNCRA